ncbi:hypothetical protein SKAU_G00412850 [Synaphobranchus kaupii]|uniref:Uncharacterized protein n=1 Tax=Synaphobranchus kaupii TaxID=118154 RepID=A0A9Q1E851_SYNKA|nr:hypothetical protein SKAU_G00412850 [Synaphobranchus kaupii]
MWLVKTDGGHLTGAQGNVVTHAMASMKAYITEEEFLSVSAKKHSEIDTYLGSTHVTTYLKTPWFTYTELWVTFGRTFFHFSSETNNKAERPIRELTNFFTCYVEMSQNITVKWMTLQRLKVGNCCCCSCCGHV